MRQREPVLHLHLHRGNTLTLSLFIISRGTHLCRTRQGEPAIRGSGDEQTEVRKEEVGKEDADTLV